MVSQMKLRSLLLICASYLIMAACSESNSPKTIASNEIFCPFDSVYVDLDSFYIHLECDTLSHHDIRSMNSRRPHICVSHGRDSHHCWCGEYFRLTLQSLEL